MAYITTTATGITLHETRFEDDGNGNLTVYGLVLTTDGNGNGTLAAPGSIFVPVVLARDEVTLSSVVTDDRVHLVEQHVSRLQQEANEISASVSTLITSTSEDIAEIAKMASLAITDEAVDIKISEAVSNGVSKVETTTGFKFNDEGLTISKSDSDMETNINEAGMVVTRSGNKVLVANNQGVMAEDLHATTYLIVGDNSRFEDYQKNGAARTGCFWIGPTN